jgi:type I restriction enzyme S subunit
VLCQSRQAFRTKPSIIVGRKGSAGEINLTQGPFWPTDVTYFVEHDNRESDLRYLFYALKMLNLQKLAKGVKPGVNRNDVYALKIPMPSLHEQKRIVVILDEAFGGIDTAVANAEKSLANALGLFESFLGQIDGKKESLGNLVDIRTGKLDANAAVQGGEYPFFTCSRQVFAIDKFAFDCEAILLGGNNAVGDFNVKHYRGKFNAYQRTYVITTNQQKRVSYRFLYFQMRRSLKAFKAQSVGAGTKFLKLDMIKNMEIVLPPVGEQARLASQTDLLLENTERLEAIYHQKIDTLAELKQTILQKAFAGALPARFAEAVPEAAE